MRYFIECAFDGTRYAGWQRQPGDPSIQQTLEEAFALILRQEIPITGCGRTDAGVHAQQYVFHCDVEQEITPDLLARFNRYLPDDIALFSAKPVAETAHARFDAVRRTYQYYIRYAKDPLSPMLSLWYGYREALDVQVMQEVAELLKSYTAFQPFCKEGSDAKHYMCNLSEAFWTSTGDGLIFTISANRFLRGMVRLIVGASLQAGKGKLDVAEIRHALDQQSPVPRADSAPAHGLHLVRVDYDHKVW